MILSQAAMSPEPEFGCSVKGVILGGDRRTKSKSTAALSSSAIRNQFDSSRTSIADTVA